MMRFADIVTQYAPALLEQYGHELLPGRAQGVECVSNVPQRNSTQDATVVRQLR